MLGKVRIKAHEKGLHFKHGDFVGLLEPGVYRFLSKLWSRKRDDVQIVSTLNTRFEHALLDVLVKNRLLAEALTIVDLADDERALVWKDGRLTYIVRAGRHAFWNEPYRLKVEVLDIGGVRFRHPKMDTILAHADAPPVLLGIEVDEHEDALVFKDGELIETLGKGRHVYFRNAGRITYKAVDRREQIADVAGQEIMTSDKVTLRVNLLVAYVVVDAVKAVTVVADYAQTLYREAQLALRAAVGTRTLDALLADKESVGGEVKNAITARAVEFGVAVRSVGLKDIILPGDMKVILNQVIEAEKAAQANLIRRREETAAARSQANTAKLLAENPMLARIKELELVKEVLEDAKLTFILGNGDLASQLRQLSKSDDE